MNTKCELMGMQFRLILMSLLVSFSLSGCSLNDSDGVKSELPSLVTAQGDRIRLEIADSPEERRDGLMFRTEMDQDAGMVFVFDNEISRSFWMKNTLIPLDVVYINSDFMIVDIQTMHPCGDQNPCPTYPSSSASRYAVELNAGTAERLQLTVGDTLSFDHISF